MKKRDRQASRRYHDRVARQYDAMYEDEYWEFYDRLTWDAIKPYLPRDAGARCCDLGCGTGKWGLKFLKSGFATTFVDQSAAMIEATRAKIAGSAKNAEKAALFTADIVRLTGLESEQFELVVAMGDVLSICSDAAGAAREMRRICKPGGVVIATADNQLAAIDHYMKKGDVEGLESFVRTGRTQWLTADPGERFELTTFSPGQFTRLFEKSGFEVVRLMGKTILPMRAFKELLKDDEAFDRLLRIESELARDSTAAARAGHLQIVARRN